jgi:hypothetical protein
MFPFHGTYITLKELHKNIHENWKQWEPTVDGLGNVVLDDLVEQQQRERLDPQFSLNWKRLLLCNKADELKKLSNTLVKRIAKLETQLT